MVCLPAECSFAFASWVMYLILENLFGTFTLDDALVRAVAMPFRRLAGRSHLPADASSHLAEQFDRAAALAFASWLILNILVRIKQFLES